MADYSDSSTTEAFIDRFQGVRVSSDGHVAQCPAHDGKRASLSINLCDDGRTLPGGPLGGPPNPAGTQH